ncbi:MAG: hypothetical protein MJ178_03845 [Treponemataceae bacterium]|nr:hypothetical protein [Treponemataceae bacterium]
MRVLILSFLSNDNETHKKILGELDKACTAKGNQVDIKNGNLESDTLRTTGYDYIAVVVQASPLFGAKVPEKLPFIMAQCGTVTGKKGCALVVKRGFSSEKMCTKVMYYMEKEGMKLDYFDVILNADHAPSVGRKIG